MEVGRGGRAGGRQGRGKGGAKRQRKPDLLSSSLSNPFFTSLSTFAGHFSRAESRPSPVLSVLLPPFLLPLAQFGREGASALASFHRRDPPRGRTGGADGLASFSMGEGRRATAAKGKEIGARVGNLEWEGGKNNNKKLAPFCAMLGERSNPLVLTYFNSFLSRVYSSCILLTLGHCRMDGSRTVSRDRGWSRGARVWGWLRVMERLVVQKPVSCIIPPNVHTERAFRVTYQCV